MGLGFGVSGQRRAAGAAGDRTGAEPVTGREWEEMVREVCVLVVVCIHGKSTRQASQGVIKARQIQNAKTSILRPPVGPGLFGWPSQPLRSEKYFAFIFYNRALLAAKLRLKKAVGSSYI